MSALEWWMTLWWDCADLQLWSSYSHFKVCSSLTTTMTMTMTMKIFLFLFIFQHLCHLLFVIGRAQGQAGWVFCINTMISQCFEHMQIQIQVFCISTLIFQCWTFLQMKIQKQVFCINTSISIQHLFVCRQIEIQVACININVSMYQYSVVSTIVCKKCMISLKGIHAILWSI